MENGPISPLMSILINARRAYLSTDHCPPWLLFVFVINMVFGTGPLTLPFAFGEAGFILGSLWMLVIMLLAFITTTYQVETCAAVNALRRSFPADFIANYRKQAKRPSLYLGKASVPQPQPVESDEDEEIQVSTETSVLLTNTSPAKPIKADFEIRERLEVGTLAEALLPSWLSKLTHGCLILYMFGCLAIFAVSASEAVSDDIGSIGSLDSYYLCLGVFAMIVIPMSFGNFQNTQHIQLIVVVLRGLTFCFMLIASAHAIFIRQTAEGDSFSFVSPLTTFDVSKTPYLLGNSIFVFMIHHSVASLITPLRPHREANRIVYTAYSVSLVAYIVLCGTALVAFHGLSNTKCQDSDAAAAPCALQKLYNLNFFFFEWKWIARFLYFYPVLTVATFPLISITLRNNLRQLLLPSLPRSFPQFYSYSKNTEWDPFNIAFTFLAVTPPLLLAFLNRDVQQIVSLTGAFAGLFIMFVVPCCLVVQARAQLAKKFGKSVKNPFHSPFRHRNWLYLVAAWILFSLAFNIWKISVPGSCWVMCN
eukprot:GILJ01003171.1.p1 GENE.GILJ01003171.1~~GILJ01003171.1.p1  ORF type:complete len:535 (+),score=35.66 GILJ01003171.1:36-1640(+)